MMPVLTIDNQDLAVPEGTSLLAAARGLGIDVPTLCWREGLEHVTSCMLCVVEDRRTGTLHPACSTPVAEGMQIASGSATVIEARRMALELLLGDHLGDCEGPCRRACAAGMDIPQMLRQIADGNWREAVRVVKRHIALPASLGRICPAPCEKTCRRGAQDAPVGICLLKRYVADADLASADPYQPEPVASSGYRVAIVGAGPAGLSAAYALLGAGHACTLFEKQEMPGGGLRSPELHDRLPLAVLDAEILQIRRLGLRLGLCLETGVEIGVTLSLAELKQRFDAVIIAWGEVSPDLASRLGLERGPHGVETDRHTHRTADPVVFACGNAVSPGRLAVRAVGQGRSTALAVDQMLRGEPVSGLRRDYDHRLFGALDAGEIAVLLADASPAPRVAPAGGPATGYTADEARAEAARCLHCDCRKPADCRLRQYAGAYGVDPRGWRPAKRRHLAIERHGRITYEPGKCIACGICVRITTAAREPLGLTFIGRGFDVRVGVPFNQSLEKGLGRVATACVDACPTGALSCASGATKGVSSP
jgi:NADPH-dependent glutamate synthase beta subunit-like oxidoreductase